MRELKLTGHIVIILWFRIVNLLARQRSPSASWESYLRVAHLYDCWSYPRPLQKRVCWLGKADRRQTLFNFCIELHITTTGPFPHRKEDGEKERERERERERKKERERQRERGEQTGKGTDRQVQKAVHLIWNASTYGYQSHPHRCFGTRQEFL